MSGKKQTNLNKFLIDNNKKQKNTEEQRPCTTSSPKQPKPTLKINDEKPFHPPHDFNFPKTKSDDCLRSCQANWFKQFPWLHYDKK